MSNPWATGSGASVLSGVVQLGELDRVVSLAHATGHLTAAQRAQCFESGALDDGVDIGAGPGRGHAAVGTVAGGNAAIDSRSSQLLVGAINRSQHLGDAVNTATVQAHRRALEANTADLTSPAQLDQKLAVLKGLSQHLTQIQHAFPELERRYAGRIFAEEHLMVEAEFHAALAELVPLVGQSLASISERCRELDSVRAILRTPGIAIDPTVVALPAQINALVDHFTSLLTARNAAE